MNGFTIDYHAFLFYLHIGEGGAFTNKVLIFKKKLIGAGGGAFF